MEKGWRDDKCRNINRLNSVHVYTGVNVNYVREFTADLYQADGELSQVGCFHRQRVTRAFRQQGEEQKWRSLYSIMFFPGMWQQVLEIRCHLLLSVHLYSGFVHTGLFWLLDSLLGPLRAPFPQDVPIVYVFLECNCMQINSH